MAKKEEAIEGEVVEKDEAMVKEARRAKLKRKARHRALLNLQINELRIDYALDVIEPDMDDLDKEIAEGKIPTYKKMVLVEATETKALGKGSDA